MIALFDGEEMRILGLVSLIGMSLVGLIVSRAEAAQLSFDDPWRLGVAGARAERKGSLMRNENQRRLTAAALAVLFLAADGAIAEQKAPPASDELAKYAGVY